MTTFWIISAALILVALAMVAPTLLRSRKALPQDRNQQNVVIAQERLAELETDLANGVIEQAQFDQTKLELEQALLRDLAEESQVAPEAASNAPGRAALAGLAVLVPAITIGLYLFLGTPQMVEVDPAALAHKNATMANGEMPSVAEMIDALKGRLKENPEDAEGWFLLGRTYMVLKDYPKAVKSYETVYKLVGEEPVVMLSLADAEAMAQKGDMSGRPAKLIRKAVALSPDDVTARWLAGMVEEQAGDLEKALSHFNALKPLLAGEADSLARVETMIQRISAKLGRPVPDVMTAKTEAPQQPAAGGARIKVRVSIAPELAAKAGPEETVFIYAKALRGPRMPLAASRLKVKDLPVEVVLDDSSAMMPQMRLSNFSEVKVGARVSHSGNAITQSGDLIGEVAPVAPAADSELVEVRIDRVVP